MRAARWRLPRRSERRSGDTRSAVRPAIPVSLLRSGFLSDGPAVWIAAGDLAHLPHAPEPRSVRHAAMGRGVPRLPGEVGRVVGCRISVIKYFLAGQKQQPRRSFVEE